MAMIEIDTLVKRFDGFTAVDGVSLTVDCGTVLGFLGPNGAGKSTTMKMITGFLTPCSGRISICGFDITERAQEAKRLIGYLPEGAPAYADMTPLEFLNFIADVRRLNGPDRRQKLDSAIARLELGPVLGQAIETLSKGFKRRVGLAQAILHDPKVLILDEPTDGLDPNQKHAVRDLITAMAATKAIIISTHILEEVEAVCSRSLIIAHGRVVAEGVPLPDGAGWRFGEMEAPRGGLDAVFRRITAHVSARHILSPITTAPLTTEETAA
ncbi:MAG: ABC transporter ATP-binding protein [Rhodospirillaceae bacterium]